MSSNFSRKSWNFSKNVYKFFQKFSQTSIFCLQLFQNFPQIFFFTIYPTLKIFKSEKFLKIVISINMWQKKRPNFLFS